MKFWSSHHGPAGQEHDIVSMRMQVWSLVPISRLRIQCCCKLCCRSQIDAAQIHCYCGCDLQLQLQLTSSLATFICCRYYCKKKKKKKKKNKSSACIYHNHMEIFVKLPPPSVDLCFFVYFKKILLDLEFPLWLRGNEPNWYP